MSAGIQQDVDLSPYNSFGVSARAAWFMALEQREDVELAREFAARHGLPILVLGEGSNILFVKDFPGLVLQVANRGMALEDAEAVTVQAGENWHDFVKQCLSSGLYGLENLALIPGKVGAAPVQNIGAYGAELEQFLVSVEVCDLLTGQWQSLSREQCEFAYRSSLFKRAGMNAGKSGQAQWLIFSLTLSLSRQFSPNLSYGALAEVFSDQAEATPQAVFEAVCAIRRSKLPDPAELGNAGSFFKNPLISAERYHALQQEYPDIPAFAAEPGLVKVPAAWLLEQAGWKGKRRGQAGVHDKHALVLVNHGGASGEDIYLLAQDMSNSVLQRFGIALQPEVRIL